MSDNLTRILECFSFIKESSATEENEDAENGVVRKRIREKHRYREGEIDRKKHR